MAMAPNSQPVGKRLAARRPSYNPSVMSDPSDKETSDKETSDKETSDKETSDKETSAQQSSGQDASDAPAQAADGSRMVECIKFGKTKEGLPKAPLKGDIGQRIFDQVSKEAWRMWLEHSKMIINEYHLDLMSETGQKVWMSELEKYFWGDGSQLPPDFVPQKAK